MTQLHKTPAILVLEDGTCFAGYGIGATGSSVGEVVFNTSMTGYQEILTDPSYAKQIVTLTYPHIGNTGTNIEDNEASRIFSSGLIIRDLPLLHSNFRSEQSLPEFLQDENIIAIAGIDTRKLTRILREKGAQNGCLMSGEVNQEEALMKAKVFPGLKGMDLAKEVSIDETESWQTSGWQLGSGYTSTQGKGRYHVVAYDFGVKRSILRNLVDRHGKVTLVPAQTSADEVMALNPDGVFLSNGPGDPEPCEYAIEAIKVFLDREIPIFGICLGHQLLGLASGARTKKMKFGHHGANHPVQNINTKEVMITSQNHGFEVDADSLPNNIKITHRSLFDGSLQGIELTDKPAFSFQGHPEASPGPQEAAKLFDHFIELMESAK